MLLLGLDFETTGLSVTEDRITEVGALVWDTDRHMPVQILNTLVKVDRDITPEITKLTGITTQDLYDWGQRPQDAFIELLALAKRCEAIVAHNGLEFDKPFLEAECQRHGILMPPLHWIDTTIDVPYPEEIKTRKLVHLAAEHDFLNPFAHRAATDVLTMMKVLSCYDCASVLATSKLPNIKLIALVKKPWEDAAPDGKKETDKAKARGYRWDGGKKRWVKNVKQNHLLAEKSHGEFQVVEDE